MATTTQRKLTTILSADIEGYSRLMGADEEGTFADLKTSRDAVARHVAAYEGRVVNTWGDGLLAEFPSVVSAVRAAIDTQSEMAERNAGKPREMCMLYRIGINLGDVIVDGDDIYGDGVNIAARLQSEAPSGGILISNTVYDQVRNKLAVGFEFLGKLDVKNIGEGVPAFVVRLGAAEGLQAPGDGAAERIKPVAEPSQLASRIPPEPASRQVPQITGIFESKWLRLAAIVPVALLVVNLLTGRGEFWAKWPLLAFAVLAGLAWARRTPVLDRSIAGLGVIGAMLVAINLFTWEGYFWAIWPLLAMAVVALAKRAIVGRA